MQECDDLEVFRLKPKFARVRSVSELKVKEPRKAGLFIRGPIYLDWLEGVLKLPGRAPVVLALALVFQTGLEKSQTIRLTRKLMSRFGISPRTCYDALAKMEQARLVEVTRQAGCCREIKIIQAQAES